MLSEMLSPDVVAIATIAAAGGALLALLFAILGYGAARRAAARPAATREEIAHLLRQEGDLIRGSADVGARDLRQELGGQMAQGRSAVDLSMKNISDSLLQRIEAFGLQLRQITENSESHNLALRTLTEQRFDAFESAEAKAARDLREELNASFQRLRQSVAETLTQASDRQKERLDATQREVKALSEQQRLAGEQLRATVEGRLDALRKENAAKLEEVRQTVDEKLQTTLEARLGESFNRVVEQLNRAYEVFGEMKTISANVGDLKNVLTNPKLRGTFGEVQLAMLLQDFLPAHQYVTNAKVRDDTSERVEFAIRMPSAAGEDVLMPVDAKFPREDHEHMIAALEAGDTLLADRFRKQLVRNIMSFARDISSKYINPPVTTERAILFLPTESLYAEVLRQPGLFENVLRECNVILSGPTTFSAILHAFHVNHRSMAIAQRSTEIGIVLGAVKLEFQKYNAVVARLGTQLKTAAGTVEKIQTRARQMDRKLRNVESAPDDGSAAKLLELDEPTDEDDPELLASDADVEVERLSAAE